MFYIWIYCRPSQEENSWRVTIAHHKIKTYFLWRAILKKHFFTNVTHSEFIGMM